MGFVYYCFRCKFFFLVGFRAFLAFFYGFINQSIRNHLNMTFVSPPETSEINIFSFALFNSHLIKVSLYGVCSL